MQVRYTRGYFKNNQLMSANTSYRGLLNTTDNNINRFLMRLGI